MSSASPDASPRRMRRRRRASDNDDVGDADSRRRDEDHGRDSEDRSNGDRVPQPARKRQRQRQHSPRRGSRRSDGHDSAYRRGEDEDERSGSRRKRYRSRSRSPGAEDARRLLRSGKYVPPHKLARLREAGVQDEQQRQKLMWDALRKSINGLVNKANAANVQHVVLELFHENLVRGRGLLCRTLMHAQQASTSFSPVYAAIAAVINTKLPEFGELLVTRLVVSFLRAVKQQDKITCTSRAVFLAHLVNQQVAHELVALQLVTMLLATPTEDSVGLAVTFVKAVGAVLSDLSPSGLHAVFERFRGILHEGDVSARTQYQIEDLFAVRKAKFAAHPAVRAELDLVEEEDQIPHDIELDPSLDTESELDVFHVDDNWDANEAKWRAIRTAILGEDDDDASDDGDGDGDDSGSEADDESGEDSQGEEDEQQQQAAAPSVVLDMTDEEQARLRRTIFLAMQSSLDFEEAAHKLLKIAMPRQEHILAEMVIEACGQQRSYQVFYGLLAQRLCLLKQVYHDAFATCFRDQYQGIHRLETNKLRNIARLFAHCLQTDALSWEVMTCLVLTEEATTSSSRIFIKILFQELCEAMGLVKLNQRLQEPSMQHMFQGLFPADTAKHLRFSINFFTSIGLGGVTDAMREKLKSMPKETAKAVDEADAGYDSYSYDSYSYDSYSYDSYSYDSGASSAAAGKSLARGSKERALQPRKSHDHSRDSVPRDARKSRDSVPRKSRDSVPRRDARDSVPRDARRSRDQSLPRRSRDSRATRDDSVLRDDRKLDDRNYDDRKHDDRKHDDRKHDVRRREDDVDRDRSRRYERVSLPRRDRHRRDVRDSPRRDRRRHSLSSSPRRDRRRRSPSYSPRRDARDSPRRDRRRSRDRSPHRRGRYPHDRERRARASVPRASPPRARVSPLRGRASPPRARVSPVRQGDA